MSEAAAFEDDGSSGLGPMLHRARVASGLTEQQAAEQLNLDATLVEALERDDLAAFGAPVFAKGHVRRYAALLGLGEDEVLSAYERARLQPVAPTLIPRAREEMLPARGRQKWPWVLSGALLFVLAAGLAAYVSEYGLDLPKRAAESIGPAQDAAQAPDATPGPVGTPTVASGDTPEPAAGTGSDASMAAADAVVPSTLPVPPGHVSIRLAFATDSWAEIYDGSGKAVLYDLGKAGTQRAIAAAAPLGVTIGNAPGVSLVVNGRPATIPAVPGGGTVARFTIEADGTVR